MDAIRFPLNNNIYQVKQSSSPACQPLTPAPAGDTVSFSGSFKPLKGVRNWVYNMFLNNMFKKAKYPRELDKHLAQSFVNKYKYNPSFKKIVHFISQCGDDSPKMFKDFVDDAMSISSEVRTRYFEKYGDFISNNPKDKRALELGMREYFKIQKDYKYIKNSLIDSKGNKVMDYDVTPSGEMIKYPVKNQK